MKSIFGFGSLINVRSLKFTVPNAKVIGPAIIYGFTRKFSHHDPIGFRTGEFKDSPMCSLDIHKAEKDNSVNGLIFEVDENYFDKLLEREEGYNLIKTQAFCYKTNKVLGEVYVFSCGEETDSYNFSNEANNYYLCLCLEGARELGKDFFFDFIKTTYINDKNLSEVKELLDIIEGRKKFNLVYVG